VTSGSTTLQARSIALEIEHRVHSLLGAVPDHVEGEKDGRWILLDYGDVVVHVFEDATREYYDLTTYGRMRRRKSLRLGLFQLGGRRAAGVLCTFCIMLFSHSKSKDY